MATTRVGKPERQILEPRKCHQFQQQHCPDRARRYVEVFGAVKIIQYKSRWKHWPFHCWRRSCVCQVRFHNYCSLRRRVHILVDTQKEKLVNINLDGAAVKARYTRMWWKGDDNEILHQGWALFGNFRESYCSVFTSLIVFLILSISVLLPIVLF